MSDEMPAPRYERYVALGDSSTEGLHDPDGVGGYRGWANRLAERLAAAQGSVMYANLGVRGRLTRQIREEQLAPALAMRPDLATLFAGSNDILEQRFDAAAFQRDLEAIQGALIESGATVVSFTFPDLEPVFSVARVLRGRVNAMNTALRGASAATGTILVDFARHRVGSDPRLWNEDRFHANSEGHARIAHALAHAIGVPGADASWQVPLDEATRPGRLSRVPADLGWGLRYAFGWALLQVLRRGTEIERGPKRPDLLPFEPRGVAGAQGVD